MVFHGITIGDFFSSIRSALYNKPLLLIFILSCQQKKDVEILFCYEPYDELVLMQLQQFDNKRLKSAEKEMREDPNISKFVESKTEDGVKPKGT